MHLGTLCDLVEELLMKIYFLKNECEKKESPILKKLTRDQFRDLSGEWFDKNYETLYEQYFKKGKANPIRIPSRKYVLDEYYGENASWEIYKKFSQEIRQYRNIIAHHYKMSFLQNEQGHLFVPKKDKINNYKRWVDVENAVIDTGKHDDFVGQDDLMESDLTQMKRVLQVLWDKPLNDFNNLLYEKKNNIIQTKYNLFFT